MVGSNVSLGPTIHGEWREDAACREVWDADVIFFPPPTDTISVWQAKKICSRCPVLAECKADCESAEKDLPRSQWFGIYGGETPRERIYRRRTERYRRNT